MIKTRQLTLNEPLHHRRVNTTDPAECEEVTLKMGRHRSRSYTSALLPLDVSASEPAATGCSSTGAACSLVPSPPLGWFL